MATNKLLCMYSYEVASSCTLEIDVKRILLFKLECTIMCKKNANT